jgi:hypothetical protein
MDGEEGFRLRTCTRKRGYPTLEHAERRARRINENEGREAVQAYLCPSSCGGWHVGGIPGIEKRVERQPNHGENRRRFDRSERRRPPARSMKWWRKQWGQ